MPTHNPTRWRAWFQRTPVLRPRIEPSLCELGAIERAAEVLRYSVASAEYWLAPGGTLRMWMRLNLAAALLIGVPAAFVGPLLRLLAQQLVDGSALLVELVRNLVMLIAWSGALAGLLIAIALAVKLITRRIRSGGF